VHSHTRPNTLTPKEGETDVSVKRRHLKAVSQGQRALVGLMQQLQMLLQGLCTGSGGRARLQHAVQCSLHMSLRTDDLPCACLFSHVQHQRCSTDIILYNNDYTVPSPGTRRDYKCTGRKIHDFPRLIITSIFINILLPLMGACNAPYMDRACAYIPDDSKHVSGNPLLHKHYRACLCPYIPAPVTVGLQGHQPSCPPEVLQCNSSHQHLASACHMTRLKDCMNLIRG
jgi:hypothetical protein